MVKSSEMHSNYKKYEDAQRAELARRPTSLRLEGDMNTTTETAEKFMEMLINQRADLAKATSNLETTQKYNAKTPSSLQLEGKMFTQSEKQEKYIPFNLEQRPALFKRSTNLRLEGQMETETENRGKYIPLDGQRQPLLKRPTNLHLEGDMEIKTESSLQYVPVDSQRPPLAKRDTNLQLEGDLHFSPEHKHAYVQLSRDAIPKKVRRPHNNLGSDYSSDRDESPEKIFKAERHQMIPLYKDNYKPLNVEKEPLKRPKENLKPEGVIDLTTESQKIGLSNQDNLMSKVMKPDIGRQEIRQRVREQRAGNLKSEGRIESNPEYRSSYVDFPRERPVVRKPTGSLRPSDERVSILYAVE